MDKTTLRLSFQMNDSGSKSKKRNVTPRAIEFDFSDLTDLLFFDNNRLKTSFILGLSAAIPHAEDLIIEKMRLYRDRITDAELLDDMRGIIGQEAHHSRVHAAFNNKAKELGSDVPGITEITNNRMRKSIGKLSEKEQLALAVCYEHITALFGNVFAKNPEVLEGLKGSAHELMSWHAMEEIEHKSVCFDVYMAIFNDRKCIKKMAHKAYYNAMTNIHYGMFLDLKSSKTMPKMKDISGFLHFLFSKKGIVRASFKDSLKIYSNNFDPREIDNTEFVNKWVSENSELIQRTKKASAP
ncbi:hypothetical protein A3715_00025 [Oleiphilus sp. HI0009]|nr:hypothetical protein A3715_00025 [Oleiphilus sp. HI0009]